MKGLVKKIVVAFFCVTLFWGSVPICTEAKVSGDWDLFYISGAPAYLSSQNVLVEGIVYDTDGYYEKCYTLSGSTNRYMTIGCATDGYSMSAYMVTTTGEGNVWKVTRASSASNFAVSFRLTAQNCTTCSSTGTIYAK